MDINDLRSIMTVLSFATFIGIIWWAYGKGSKKGFDEAANLPFVDDDDATAAPGTPRNEQRKTS